MAQATRGRLTKTRVGEIVSTYKGPTRDYAPDLFEELEGIARAADVSVEELLALNAFLELHDYYSEAFAVSGCTSLMVPGTTSGEGALIAQNYDLSSIYASAAVLIKVKSERAPDALFYTSAGILGCAGINAAGIGVVINNLVPSDAGGGILYPFVIRRVLEAVRIGDAIDAVVAKPRASGMNYVLCDENGEIYDLETTAREYEVICPFDGPMAHANHYLTDRLKPFERRQWDQRGRAFCAGAARPVVIIPCPTPCGRPKRYAVGPRKCPDGNMPPQRDSQRQSLRANHRGHRARSAGAKSVVHQRPDR